MEVRTDNWSIRYSHYVWEIVSESYSKLPSDKNGCIGIMYNKVDAELAARAPEMQSRIEELEALIKQLQGK